MGGSIVLGHKITFF